MVECGADPNGRDVDYNTPLHVVAATASKTAKPALASALLECGAHLDTVNVTGKSFLYYVKGLQAHEIVNEVKFTSLQCLAARAIKQHGILYENEIPQLLVDFVELH